MRRSPVALVPIAVSILIAACAGDRDTTAPPRTVAPSPAASALTLPTTCSYTQLKADARDYFAKSTDVVFDYISAASKATEPQKTAIHWQIINEVAVARLSARQVSPWSSSAAAGERVLKDNFVCMQGIGDVSSIPDGALTSALSYGGIAVRGAGYLTGPVLGYLAVGGAKALSVPAYGVEHQPAGSSWGANPFLVVLVPTQYGPTYLQYGAYINTNGDPKNGFESYTIPVDQSKTGDVIGVCVSAIASGQGAANMLVHAGRIMEHIAPTQICDPQYAVLAPRSWFASLTQRAVSFLAPKAAFADEIDAADYSGGGPTSWSPNIIGTVVANNVQLAFTAQFPTVAKIGDNVHFEVTATINGQPVPDVDVTIAIYGNNGTPGTIVGTTTVPTDGNGVATFNVSFTKAGGYFIQATGMLAGFPTQSALSQQFWIKNQ